MHFQSLWDTSEEEFYGTGFRAKYWYLRKILYSKIHRNVLNISHFNLLENLQNEKNNFIRTTD